MLIVHVKDAEGSTLRLQATKGGALKVVSMVLQTDETAINTSNRINETPLSAACSCDLTDVVQRLLNVQSIDVNLQRPLLAAAQQDQHEIVKLLLENQHINVNVNDELQYTA